MAPRPGDRAAEDLAHPAHHPQGKETNPMTRRSHEQCIPCRKPVRRTEIEAIADALALSARYGTAYRPYPCPYGNGHHLTTRPLRDGRPTTQEETQP